MECSACHAVPCVQVERACAHGQLVEQQQHGGQLHGGVAIPEHCLNEIVVRLGAAVLIRRGGVPDLRCMRDGGRCSLIVMSRRQLLAFPCY